MQNDLGGYNIWGGAVTLKLTHGGWYVKCANNITRRIGNCNPCSISSLFIIASSSQSKLVLFRSSATPMTWASWQVRVKGSWEGRRGWVDWETEQPRRLAGRPIILSDQNFSSYLIHPPRLCRFTEASESGLEWGDCYCCSTV